jgi:hypothetical protein
VQPKYKQSHVGLSDVSLRTLVAFDSFGRSKGVRSLGFSEPDLRLRRVVDAPFNRSLCDSIVVVLDVPLTLVARTSVGIGVRGLPTYIVDHESASGMDEWLARRGGFTNVPRGTSSSLSLLKAFIAICR